MPRINTNPMTLRRILQQELLLGKQLVTLAEEETDVIVRDDPPRLQELQLEQQKLFHNQIMLEATRVSATRDLAWKYGLDTLPTLSVLLGAMPEREREPFVRLRKELLDVQDRLDRIYKRNRLLLENALEYVRFSLELLTTATLMPARYGTNLASIDAPAFYIDSKA